MPHRRIEPPGWLKGRLASIGPYGDNYAPLFLPAMRPAGIWCPEEHGNSWNVLLQMMPALNTTGVILVPVSDPDGEVSLLESPDETDRDWFMWDSPYYSRGEVLLAISAADDWAGVWDEDNMAAFAAVERLVYPLQEAVAELMIQLDPETADHIAKYFGGDPDVEFSRYYPPTLRYFDGLIRWEYPADHEIRRVWDSHQAVLRARGER